MTPRHLPLDGLKVLDLGTMVTAPLAAMLLGQLGADVTKVEHPAGGDPFRKTTGGEYSPNFIAYNQNKTSIQIDLGKTGGRARFLDLVAATDILIENYRPGVMDRLGLDANALASANPGSSTAPSRGLAATALMSIAPPTTRWALRCPGSSIFISILRGHRSSGRR